jgi:hypothetical protein
VFTNIAAGTYSITVKDSRGCTSVKSVTVTGSTSGALQIYLIAKTNNSCRWTWDGTITVGATGGTAPYTFAINSYGYGSRNTFINLGPGTYTLHVKDATGAHSSMSVTILASTQVCSGKTSGKGTAPAEATTTSADGLELQAYPNPTATTFSLVVKSDNNNDEAQVVVMNMNGQKVYQGKTRSNQKLVFGNEFGAGTYFVKVLQADKTQTLKLIKTK